MTQDRPSTTEMIAAVRGHIEQQLLPMIDDPGLRFRTLVAANVLAIAERELALAPALHEDELQRLAVLLGIEKQAARALDQMQEQLSDQIASGVFDSGPDRRRLFDHLKQTAIEKLRISNPRFLARLEAEDR